MTHQHNPNMAPDRAYELGELSHLVVGNEGRLLDGRRTPVCITAIMIETGQFEVEILDFEDQGARWVVPFEGISHYQFALGSNRQKDLKHIQAAIERFDRQQFIPAVHCPLPHFDVLCQSAAPYVQGLSIDLTAQLGCKKAWIALRSFMESLDLMDMEEDFATQFVSNPYSGELVKGHRLVIAELGLVSYEGNVVRNTTIFEGKWNRKRRAEHICARLAFVREMFKQAGMHEVLLWRGVSTTSLLEPARNNTFISTSFSRTVAQSICNDSDKTRVAVLMCQRVQVERIFMTYIETKAMNQQFLETEAILLFDAENLAF